MDRIQVKGKQFIDSSGRARIFHGVNLVCKDKQAGYVGKWSRRDFEEMRRMGFNLVRLGFIWDGVEPEPGRYNDSYLASMEGILDLCAEYGMYVLLDMHQDLYGARFSDGAPDWATITDGLPGPGDVQVWSDAYLNSEAVQRAFDHFWANDAAADGIGLQDHLAGCWRRIAQRFGARPEVLGYDFLNEPFPGSAALPIFGSLLASYSQIEARLLNRPPKTLDEAASVFADKQSMFTALQLLDDKERYRMFVDAAAPYATEFDMEALARFYSRMAEAVRQVALEGILFSENAYFGNLGVPSGVLPIAAGGRREALQGYAPHGYDLVVDTPLVGSGASPRRAGVIFENHHAAQLRLGVPVLVGEWGGFGSEKEIGGHCSFLLDTFDRYRWSFAYWAWRAGETAETEAAALLARPYPEAVSGEMEYFVFDRETGGFDMAWQGDAEISAPTVVSLPGGLAGRSVELTKGCEYEIGENRGAMQLAIRAVGGGRLRLTVR